MINIKIIYLKKDFLALIVVLLGLSIEFFYISVDHLDSFEGIAVVFDFKEEIFVLGLDLEDLIFHFVVIFHNLLFPPL